MNSIAIFSLDNLTAEQQTDLLALSQVGIAEFVESGETDKYHRLRNIDLADVQNILNVWEFPARLPDEATTAYNNRVRADTVLAFAQLKANTHGCIWLSEAGFQNLARQPEFINS